MNAVADEVAYEVDGQYVSRQAYDEHMQVKTQALYSAFAGMRNDWVAHRAQTGVEQRWRRASELYFSGEDVKPGNSLVETLTEGSPKAAKPNAAQPRSRVTINIVRNKVDQVAARICEILFPVDDRNWSIRPTPLPQLGAMIGNNAQTVDAATGQPTGLTADDEAQGVIKAAKEASDKMQRIIDDNLTECGYNGECRRVIEDGVRLGTGIIEGPYPAGKSAKKWNVSSAGAVLQISQKIAPASRRLDPWDVFFDPACGNDHQRGRGVWTRQFATRKELRKLAQTPGYDAAAIRATLLEPPRSCRIAESRQVQMVTNDKGSYEIWKYHGEVEPDDIAHLSAKAGDPLTDVDFGVVVVVNDRVICVMESWVEDGVIPMDVWNYRKADDSPFGFGLPDELYQKQSIATTAWRQLMDNAKASMGGQIVMKRKNVEPADGNWAVSPMKMWLATDDSKDVKDTFTVFQFDSHIEELLKLAEAAVNLADIETGLPQLMQGEMGSSPETLGGMIMLFNNANAVLRMRVKQFDDNVTRPHITRYYDYNMANHDDVTAKGDFEVDARGSSSLLERDIQNQAMINLANITSSPRFAPMMKDREELKAILKAFRLNPDDLMKTEEQVKKDMANAPQQQDPRVAAAQATLQAKQMDIQDRQQQRQFDAQIHQSDDAYRRDQMQYNMQREQAEFQIAMTDSEVARDTAIMRENNSLTLSREANQARERMNLLNLETKRDIFNAEASLRVRTGQGV